MPTDPNVFPDRWFISQNTKEDALFNELEADDSFKRKGYDKAYRAYDSVLEAEPDNIKARFRKELIGQYLLMESSSVYLSCDGFFAEIKDIKQELIGIGNEELSFLVCRDMLDFMSLRADYEKKYAAVHKNEKAAATFMNDTLLLLEYTAETVISMKEKTDVMNNAERIRLVCDGCALGMKLRAMLLSGAEYLDAPTTMDDISDAGAPSRSVSRVKRRRLSQADEIQVETVAGNMRKAKAAVIASADPSLAEEIAAIEEKNEKALRKQIEETDSRNMDSGLWRAKNQKEYETADKMVLIFRTAVKGAALLSFVMLLIFLYELVVSKRTSMGFVVFAVIFAAVSAACGFAEKSEEKKKAFYADIINADSAGMHASGVDYKYTDER